jgi:hypothetical protein
MLGLPDSSRVLQRLSSGCSGRSRILLASFLSKDDFMRLQTPTESSTSPTELESSSSPEPAHQGSPDLLDRSVFDIFG